MTRRVWRLVGAFVAGGVSAGGLAAGALWWAIETGRLVPYYAESDLVSLEARRSDVPEGIVTSLHQIGVEVLDLPADPGRGGAIASAGGLTLWASRGGVFRRIGAEGPEDFALAPPFEIGPLEAPFGDSFERLTVGVRDLLLRERGGGWDVYLSHTALGEGGCLELRVAATFLPGGRGEGAEWRTLYASRPCLDIAEPLSALSAAGAMALAPDGALLVAVGDFGIDGVGRHRGEILPSQAPDWDLGKVMRVALPEGGAELFTLGHRNPSGIAVTPEGDIWQIEHGPRGGDELNLLRQGANYGWPLATHGTDYNGFDWPFEPGPEELAGFTPPQWAWVPSVALSTLAYMEGPAFPDWEGDLIAGSLKAGSLYRIRLADRRPVLIEPILLGLRIRDIAVTAAGEILVLPDEAGRLLRLVPVGGGPAPEGLALCAGCHQVSPDQGGDFAGPTLVGVFGRDIAGVEGYPYSDALRARSGVWRGPALRLYLTDTGGFAPGGRMPQVDIGSAEVYAVVRALRRLSE